MIVLIIIVVTNVVILFKVATCILWHLLATVRMSKIGKLDASMLRCKLGIARNSIIQEIV